MTDCNYIALIPARGGSKGLPGKNIKNLAGKPLITWSIDHALECDEIKEVYVSTDCPEIAEIARQAGAKVPELRPAHLAADTSSTESVMLQVARDWLEWDSSIALILLQPTSPLRLPGSISSAIDLFEKFNADSLVSVCKDHSFFWKNPQNPVALYNYKRRPRRQDIPPQDTLYKENGSIYITKLSALKSSKNRLCGKIAMFCMSEKESFEIDSQTEFDVIESLLSREKL